jgi:hypothetical protein
MTPLSKHDTAVTLNLIFDQLWLPFERISIEKTFIGKYSYTIAITFTQKFGDKLGIVFCHSCVIDTAVTKVVDFVVDFLREFEAIFKRHVLTHRFRRWMVDNIMIWSQSVFLA